MKTAITILAMLALATPASAAYCRYPRQPHGTGNSLMTEFVDNNCQLTKKQRREKSQCDTMNESNRPRSCWAFYNLK